MRLIVYSLLMLATALSGSRAAASGDRELPIEFREGLLWVKVSTPRSDQPLNFLLDTGASTSVLNLDTARRLGVKLGRQVPVTGVNARLIGYWPVSLSAKAGDVDLPGRYLALDLSRLSAACSNRVDGLIGADFFRDRVVQIDYAAERLRLPARSNAGNVGDAIPLEARPCGLRVQVSVNEGRSGWMRLDTGCATALQWVTSEVPSESCSRKPAVGLAELSIPQTETCVRLGSARVDHVPTGLHREAIFSGECGLMGNELLAQFGVITIDARNHRLILGRAAVK